MAHYKLSMGYLMQAQATRNALGYALRKQLREGTYVQKIKREDLLEILSKDLPEGTITPDIKFLSSVLRQIFAELGAPSIRRRIDTYYYLLPEPKIALVYVEKFLKISEPVNI